jgi:hypothetical protein
MDKTHRPIRLSCGGEWESLPHSLGIYDDDSGVQCQTSVSIRACVIPWWSNACKKGMSGTGTYGAQIIDALGKSDIVSDLGASNGSVANRATMI